MIERDQVRGELLIKNKEITQKLPVAQQQPQLFLWKRMALLLSGLIAVVLVIDIIMLLYLSDHPEPPVNLTFINSMIDQSQIIQTKEHIVNLLNLVAKSNPNIKFQYSNKLLEGSGMNFTYDRIIEKTMTEGYEDLFYLFELAQGTLDLQSRVVVGVYIPESFKVPKISPDNDDDPVLNKTLEYYTFEFGDHREATYFGLGQALFRQEELELENSTFPGYFLKANSTTNKDLDPMHCKTYKMLYEKNYLTFLQIMKINFSMNTSHPTRSSSDENVQVQKPATIEIRLNENETEFYECFYKVSSQRDLEYKLDYLFDDKIDVESTEEIRLNRFEIFQLINQ